MAPSSLEGITKAKGRYREQRPPGERPLGAGTRFDNELRAIYHHGSRSERKA
jgi:hypothetical protein